jgi:hypothetical protein
VFDVISDPRRRLEWQSSLLNLQMHSRGAPGVGTRWRETTKSGLSFELEITRFEPPALWAEVAHGAHVDAEIAVEFLEAGDATIVNVSVEMSFKGLFKLLAPMAWLFMPRAFARDLDRTSSLAKTAKPRSKPVQSPAAAALRD